MKCKKHLSLFGLIYLLALLFAIIGRFTLIYLDSQHAITYHYIAKTNVPLLTKLLSIFTGVQLLALLLSFGLILCLYLATHIVFAFKSYKGDKFSLPEVSIISLCNIIFSILVMIIFFAGSLSKLQLKAMKSSSVLAPVLILILLSLITLFIAKARVIDAALKKNKCVFNLVIYLFIFTSISSFLSAIAFANFNLLIPNINGLLRILVIALAFNLFVIFGLNHLPCLNIKKCES